MSRHPPSPRPPLSGAVFPVRRTPIPHWQNKPAPVKGGGNKVVTLRRSERPVNHRAKITPGHPRVSARRPTGLLAFSVVMSVRCSRWGWFKLDFGRWQGKQHAAPLSDLSMALLLNWFTDVLQGFAPSSLRESGRRSNFLWSGRSSRLANGP